MKVEGWESGIRGDVRRGIIAWSSRGPCRVRHEGKSALLHRNPNPNPNPTLHPKPNTRTNPNPTPTPFSVQGRTRTPITMPAMAPPLSDFEAELVEVDFLHQSPDETPFKLGQRVGVGVGVEVRFSVG